MWFIGLQFSKTEHVNVDLTYDIRSFVDTGEPLLYPSSIFIKAKALVVLLSEKWRMGP